MDLLQVTRVTVAIVMLAGAAALDLRSRRVPNGYWMPFVLVAAALLVIDLGLHGTDAMALPVAAALVVAAFAYLVWRLRLFGGADAKAIMVLAALVPGLPPAGTFGVPFALDTLMNGTLVAVFFPILLLAWNLATGHFRLPAALLGFPLPLDVARGAHVWPMQQFDQHGVLRWRYWTHVGMDTEGVYDRLAAQGVGTVWVTAKLPLCALMAAGAVVAVFWGNILLHLAQVLAAR